MEVFEEVSWKGVVIYLSITFTALNVYLTLNKLWSRKHHRAVAESISLGGRFVAIAAVTIISLNFIFHDHWQGVVNMSILISSEFLQVLIGAGFWVESERKKGLFNLIRSALELEKNESTDLAKAIFRPSSADKVIEILRQVAMIDGVLDNREKQFINSFATSWGIEIPWEEISNKAVNELDFDQLRTSMTSYLSTVPPKEQVLQLGDLLSLLVKIDDEVSESEELMLEELNGLIRKYTDTSEESWEYYTAIVPQNPEQDEAIRAEVGEEGKKQPLAGGMMYLIGPYYSPKYTEIMCEKYRSHRYLSMVIQKDIKSEKFRFFDAKKNGNGA
jgi:hypothetical protein